MRTGVSASGRSCGDQSRGARGGWRCPCSIPETPRPTPPNPPGTHRRVRALLLRAPGGCRPDGTAGPRSRSRSPSRGMRAPRAGFFVCQQHFPRISWNVEFQRHDNKAVDIAAVASWPRSPGITWVSSRSFTGSEPERIVDQDHSLPLQGARLDLMTLDDAAEVLGSVEIDPDQPAFAAVSIRSRTSDGRADGGRRRRRSLPAYRQPDRRARQRRFWRRDCVRSNVGIGRDLRKNHKNGFGGLLKMSYLANLASSWSSSSSRRCSWRSISPSTRSRPCTTNSPRSGRT